MNKSLEQYMPDGSKLPYRFMKYRIHKILLVLHVGRQQVQPGNVMLLYGVPLCRLRDTV